MLNIKLVDEHVGGVHILELWRTEHNDVGIVVADTQGSSQFDFTLDDSDLEILSIMIERAREARKLEE